MEDYDKPTNRDKTWRCQLSAEGKRCLFHGKPDKKNRQGVAWRAPSGYLTVRWDGMKTTGCYSPSYIDPVIDDSELEPQQSITRMSEQEPKDAPSGLELGNLAIAYAGGASGWPGCYNQDCLPKCKPSKNHCERLRLFLERGKGH